MPKFVPTKKKKSAPPRPAPEPEVSSEELHRLAVKALVEWEATDRRIREHRARGGVKDDDPALRPFHKTRVQLLADRRRDAKSVGWPEPIALTDSGESVYGYTSDGRPVTTVGGRTATPPPVPPPPPSPPVVAAKASAPANRASVPAPVVFKPKPGVVAKIVEIVGAATKKRPATIAGIVAVLSKAFPERDPQKMKKTVTSQLHGAMEAEKGIVVSRDGAGGYWISK